MSNYNQLQGQQSHWKRNLAIGVLVAGAGVGLYFAIPALIKLFAHNPGKYSVKFQRKEDGTAEFTFYQSNKIQNITFTYNGIIDPNSLAGSMAQAADFTVMQTPFGPSINYTLTSSQAAEAGTLSFKLTGVTGPLPIASAPTDVATDDHSLQPDGACQASTCDDPIPAGLRNGIEVTRASVKNGYDLHAILSAFNTTHQPPMNRLSTPALTVDPHGALQSPSPATDGALFPDIAAMQQRFPYMHPVLPLGEASAGVYKQIAASPALLKAFTTNVVEAALQMGADINIVITDLADFPAAIAAALRQGITDSGQDIELGISVPHSTNTGNNLKAISNAVDVIQVDTCGYDQDSIFTGYSCPIELPKGNPSGAGLDAKTTLEIFIKAGADPSKLSLGSEYSLTLQPVDGTDYKDDFGMWKNRSNTTSTPPGQFDPVGGKPTGRFYTSRLLDDKNLNPRGRDIPGDVSTHSFIPSHPSGLNIGSTGQVVATLDTDKNRHYVATFDGEHQACQKALATQKTGGKGMHGGDIVGDVYYNADNDPLTLDNTEARKVGLQGGGVEGDCSQYEVLPNIGDSFDINAQPSAHASVVETAGVGRRLLSETATYTGLKGLWQSIRALPSQAWDSAANLCDYLIVQPVVSVAGDSPSYFPQNIPKGAMPEGYYGALKPSENSAGMFAAGLRQAQQQRLPQSLQRFVA